MGYKGADYYDLDMLFPSYPPADPICFNMWKLINPDKTYNDFLNEWRKNEFSRRNNQCESNSTSIS